LAVTGSIDKQWGSINTEIGTVPLAPTSFSRRDRIGHLKVRLGLGRMNYTVSPGLFAVGHPHKESPVFVSANYKLSFDTLRRELTGLDAWILVLDTKGINVWCAAGKGTFGTDELVFRIKEVNLSKLIDHRKLILPQLGAPGIASHEVTKRTGFKVIYGPVRAGDIVSFIESGLVATMEMRRVRFTLADRLTLAPIEIVEALKPLVLLGVALFLVDLLGLNVFSLKGYLPYAGAVLVGNVLVPLLLPWIPGRAFAFKGWLLGMLFALFVNILYGHMFSATPDWKQALVYFLTLPALSSFLGMSFTGSSTFTSLSGVVKEMKFAVPFIVVTGFLGLSLMILKVFIDF
jgi:hypothetical protein